MNNFFNQIKPVEKSTLEQNKINGKESERHIAGLLTTAINARVSFTSRTEDDAKIDLITCFSHPWLNNEVQVLSTQVKSGNSFCSIDNDKLILIKKKFSNLLNRNNWALVCWTTTDNKNSFWFLIKPNSKFIKLEYNSNHIINPLTKFHLIRIIYSIDSRNGGKGLVFKRKNSRQDYERNEFLNLRKCAKQKYSRLKKINIINPLFGKIEFTRLGWRHITRESRWYYFKTASFEVLSILDKLLSVSPSKHYTLKHLKNESDELIYIENEYLLNYSNTKVFDAEQKKNLNVEVFIKILEISCYKKAWKETPLNNNFTFRRVIFKSIYYKQSS
ncbi:hypothetical protein [Elizabethkingia anophelis]|uniref:DUF4365 domain-containing protein n=1 Tax=Elizabethkingia anophelis TaxID=1117645 RepID=A0A494J595_9FLAO|nr:hypothetical protein [Elizabethkingia anophelis]AQX50415.1 hypothetical protein AYC66_06895 [Elizabethkingia anophelis]MCT4198983.1 hypothetical protein [Elizabethkingia anophelis]MCT4227226.1 hypothetical protein [Elizabethkingia anophelis]MCT4309365.1 hypothetical protein [Elizabethkingia anophelis]MDV2473808.1 hypothetical protein [Elizabethkingia anophelis]